MSELIVFEYQGEQVTYDPAEQMWNLNAMHQAAGEDPSKAPRFWLRQTQSKEFMAALAEELTVSQDHSLVVTGEGRNGGTWAHWQIAAAYAHYLNPKFYLQWNRWAMERKQQLDTHTAPDDLFAQIAALNDQAAVLNEQVARLYAETRVTLRKIKRDPKPRQLPITAFNEHHLIILAVLEEAADEGRTYATMDLLAACGYTRSKPNSFFRHLAQLRSGGYVQKGDWMRSPIMITDAGRRLLAIRSGDPLA